MKRQQWFWALYEKPPSNPAKYAYRCGTRPSEISKTKAVFFQFISGQFLWGLIAALWFTECRPFVCIYPLGLIFQ